MNHSLVRACGWPFLFSIAGCWNEKEQVVSLTSGLLRPLCSHPSECLGGAGGGIHFRQAAVGWGLLMKKQTSLHLPEHPLWLFAMLESQQKYHLYSEFFCFNNITQQKRKFPTIEENRGCVGAKFCLLRLNALCFNLFLKWRRQIETGRWPAGISRHSFSDTVSF